MSRSPALPELDRETLAVLVPELVLAGHLIDRAGLPHAIAAFGRDGMRDVAIEEWMGASPVSTRRMQGALGFAGGGVETTFEGMQLEVGPLPSSWTSGTACTTGTTARARRSTTCV